MEASLLIRLVDQLSGPAQKVRQGLKGIGDAAKEVKKAFASSIKQGLSIDNIEKATQNAERRLSQARQKLLGAAASAGTILLPAKFAADFSAEMSNVSTLIDTATESMAAMKEQVLGIGDRVPVVLSELPDALYDVRSAGISASDAMGVLEGSARLAVAGLGSSKEAVDLVTSSINAFNLKGEDQAKIYDMIFKAVKNGKTTISGLAQGFGAVAGTIAAAHVQIDEYLASVAALTTTGMPAAQAHTQIRAAIVGLTRDTKETSKVFKQLHVKNFKELVDKSGGMVAAFTKIRDVLHGDDAAMQALFGSSEAVNAVLGLTGAQADVFKTALDDMRTGVNAVDEAFRKQSEEPLAQWRMMGNQLRHVAIVVGTELLPVMLDLMKTVQPLLHDLVAWTKANPELTHTIVTGVAAILGMSVALRLLSYGAAAARLPLIGLVATFLKFDKTGRNVAIGWRAIAGSARLLAGSFSLLASAGGLVPAALGTIGSVLAGIGTAIATVTAPVWGMVAAVVAALAAVGFAVYKYWDRISSFVKGFASVFADAFSSILESAAGIGGQIVDWIGAIFDVPAEKIAAFKAAVATGFASAFDISGLLSGIKQKAASAWETIKSFFAPERLSSEQKAGFEDAGRKLGQAIIDGIKSAAEALWKWFASWPSMIREAIGSIDLSDLFQWPSIFGGEAPEGAPPKAPDIGPSLKGVSPAKDSNWFSDLFGFGSDLSGAGDDLASGGQRGGEAVAKGGQDAAAALSNAARELRAASAGIQNLSRSPFPTGAAALYDGGND